MKLRDFHFTIALIIIAPGFLWVSAGCSPMKPAKTVVEMAQEPQQALTLGADDVIDVKHFYVPELDESQIVRPDGYMTLPLIGDVNVAGKTPAQLQKSWLKNTNRI